MLRFFHPFIIGIVISVVFVFKASAALTGCADNASAACYFSFTPAGQSLNMHFYASVDPKDSAEKAMITRAVIAMHGHPRDANKTFNATLAAAKNGQALNNTLVVAPVYQVPAGQAKKCSTTGVPIATNTDLTWTCGTWLEGGVSNEGKGLSSFAVMDALVVQLQKDFPNLNTITIAGFSAGAQMIQHYIGFSADVVSTKLKLRFVVSDPGSWLYFDNVRAKPYLGGSPVAWENCKGGAEGLGDCEIKFGQPEPGCATTNSWKYGLDQLPSYLTRNSEQARARYAAADIHYLEGALDSSKAKGTYYGILDKSCAAQAQGPYRLQRGVVFAAYSRAVLNPKINTRVTIVPNCAHDVACVFPSKQAQSALFGN
jgi:hypothetical protein